MLSKFLKKKIFKTNSKIRIYLYLFSIFFVLIFLYTIYTSHQNRNIINSIKYYYNQNIYVVDENRIDFISDSSLTKFVNNIISFNKLSYLPESLVYVSSKYVGDSKWNSRLRSEANEELQKMANDFYETFGEKIIVVSAYRSYEYQVGIKSRWCSDLLCAKAWFSEHQTWLAFDLWETTTKEEFLSKPNLVIYFNWLKKNAHKYWFHNTYQKGLKVDWYLTEPWHWRYLWKNLAEELYNNNQTLAEYYYINK